VIEVSCGLHCPTRAAQHFFWRVTDQVSCQGVVTLIDQ